VLSQHTNLCQKLCMCQKPSFQHGLLSVLQCVAEGCSGLQCVAVCCGVLQCVAACCSVLQCSALTSICAQPTDKYVPMSNTSFYFFFTRGAELKGILPLNTLQHAATRCNTLQHAATRRAERKGAVNVCMHVSVCVGVCVPVCVCVCCVYVCVCCAYVCVCCAYVCVCVCEVCACVYGFVCVCVHQRRQP